MGAQLIFAVGAKLGWLVLSCAENADAAHVRLAKIPRPSAQHDDVLFFDDNLDIGTPFSHALSEPLRKSSLSAVGTFFSSLASPF
jgi:hypothetical protein